MLAAVQALRSEFKNCYVAELARDKNASGYSCVRFAIDPDGGVATAELASDTLSETLQECILFSVGRVKLSQTFPAPTIVAVPIRFVRQ